MPIDKCIWKVCYDNKVCNPTTGRCIKQKPVKPKSCEDIKCPDGKVCNSKTLRCNKQKNDRKHKRQFKSSYPFVIQIYSIINTCLITRTSRTTWSSCTC